MAIIRSEDGTDYTVPDPAPVTVTETVMLTLTHAASDAPLDEWDWRSLLDLPAGDILEVRS